MAPARLLVIRNSGLGDLLMELPALKALRRHFPSHEMFVTCPDALTPVLDLLDIAAIPVTEQEDRSKPAAAARHHQETDRIILDRLLAEGTRYDVVVALRVPRTALIEDLRSLTRGSYLGFADPDLSTSGGLPHFDETVHILARWSGLLAAFGVPVDQDDLYLAPEHSDDRAVHRVIVHPGAASPSREWPVERWARLSRALRLAGLEVLLTGGPGDVGKAERVRISAGLEPAADRSGATNVLELFELVRQSDLVISGDTGIAHVATVLRRRSLTLFGPMPPSRWGPPPGTPRHHALWTGGLGDAYGPSVHPGLLEIEVSDVVAALAARSWIDGPLVV